MPRPNKPRSIQAERALADRIAREREARGWSRESLAKRVTDVGCPIDATAIWKIEKGDPPRRIVVNELVALSRVFGTTFMEDLLVDSAPAAVMPLWKVIYPYFEAVDAIGNERARIRKLERQIAARASSYPPEAVRVALSECVEYWDASDGIVGDKQGLTDALVELARGEGPGPFEDVISGPEQFPKFMVYGPDDAPTKLTYRDANGISIAWVPPGNLSAVEDA